MYVHDIAIIIVSVPNSKYATVNYSWQLVMKCLMLWLVMYTWSIQAHRVHNENLPHVNGMAMKTCERHQNMWSG